jgi:hypothetical protein
MDACPPGSKVHATERSSETLSCLGVNRTRNGLVCLRRSKKVSKPLVKNSLSTYLIAPGVNSALIGISLPFSSISGEMTNAESKATMENQTEEWAK